MIDSTVDGQKAVDLLISSYKNNNLSNQNKGVIYKVILMDINMPKLNGF